VCHEVEVEGHFSAIKDEARSCWAEERSADAIPSCPRVRACVSSLARYSAELCIADMHIRARRCAFFIRTFNR
jgi:hypothetical protein